MEEWTIFYVGSATSEIGDEYPEELMHVMQALKERLAPVWLPEALKNLAKIEKEGWRTRRGPDPPYNVQPFKTSLKPGARPVRCGNRKYTHVERGYLEEFVGLLEQYGFVLENVNSEWASPVLVVKRPNGQGFRMVVDYRELNKLCEGVAFPMPDLDALVNELAESKYFFSLDAFKGFWYMPLHEEDMEMFSFKTHKGVYTPTRSMQGALNSATLYQARLHSLYKEYLWKNLIIWIDDLLGHAKTLEEWFTVLEQVLLISEKVGLVFSITKCDLLLK